MFELVINTKHVWDLLAIAVLKTPKYFPDAEVSSIPLDYVDMGTRHDIDIMKYPSLVCTYIYLPTEDEAASIGIFQCKKKYAKALLYPNTNKLGNIGEICNSKKDYSIYVNHLNDNFNPVSLEHSHQTVGLIIPLTQVVEGRNYTKLISLTLQEAKSLVYYKKDRRAYESLNRPTKKKILRRNSIGGGDDIPF